MQGIPNQCPFSLNTEKLMTIPIEEYFRYHPPTTEERKAKHEAINASALELAKALEKAAERYLAYQQAVLHTVKDAECFQSSILALETLEGLLKNRTYIRYIQQSRMFANQGITVDELKSKQEV